MVISTEKSDTNLFPFLTLVNENIFVLQSDGSVKTQALRAQKGFPQASPMQFNGEINTRYTLSLDYLCDGAAGTTGSGLYIGFVYSDNTASRTSLGNGASVYTHTVYTSTANKTIIGIYFQAGSFTNNNFYLKNIMMNKGTVESSFTPSFVYVDEIARKMAKNTNDLIQQTTKFTGNVLDEDFLLDFGGWTKELVDGFYVYHGLSNSIPAKTILENIFSENQVWTISFEGYTDGETTQTGNGFRIYFDYTDESTMSKYIENSASSWTEISLTSNINKTISKVSIAAASGSGGNTWHIRKFQLRQSNYVKPFIPYKSGTDYALKDEISVTLFNKLPWWNNGRIKFAMHQGMRSDSQPIGNCELSFRTAGINKAWAIETDIRLTFDNKWVCFHDISVDTLTNGTGNVSALTLAQIKELYYVNQTTGVISDQKILTFQEYLQICKTYNCVPLIEWKIRPSVEQVKEIVSILNEYGFCDSDYMFIGDTMRSDTLRRITKAPTMQVVASVDDANKVINYVKGSKIDNWGIDFDRYIGAGITHELIDTIHKAGMFCSVYSVNSASNVKEWFSLGIDIVTSDYLTDLND